jgi:hypothetical protein
LTSTDTAAAFFDVLVRKGEGTLKPEVVSLQEYLGSIKKS